MLVINPQLQIPDSEFTWTYVRSGGPGGQNVNKVASKAVLRWNLAASPSLPEHVKMRLKTLQRRRVTGEGELVLTSQRYRDQERNREDCLQKLREMIAEAATMPKPRRATRPTRRSKERRLNEKRKRSSRKVERRSAFDEESRVSTVVFYSPAIEGCAQGRYDAATGAALLGLARRPTETV